jgi:hypothetical protein
VYGVHTLRGGGRGMRERTLTLPVDFRERGLG